MRREHAVGEQIAKLRLGPTADDEPGDEMQVGARVDVVRNAGGDDREDMSGALPAFIEPRKEPILTAMESSP